MPFSEARVAADAADEHLVLAGGGRRRRERREVEDADARGVAEDLRGLLRRESALQLDPDRLRVPDHHRHADTRRGDRQVGQLEDLPRLGAELRLLVRLVALPASSP